MRSKKLMALIGMVFLLGGGLAFAQNQEKNQIQLTTGAQERTRLMFMDQNGDGINDFLRDHDQDGLPNCQDPDWSKPLDGKGYQNQFGQPQGKNQFGDNHRFSFGKNWSNSSFRQGLHPLGSGLCDGLGPKGKVSRHGRR